MTVMENEDPADPSAHEPRVTDAPEAVWLVYGDIDRDSTHRECCASGEVMWCEDAQFAADVRYLRADLLYIEARQIAAQEVAAERERWRATIEDAAHQLEKARIWAGMEWHYNPLHPMHYLPALKRLRDALRA